MKKKHGVQHLQPKSACIYSKDMNIKDIKYLWIDFIPVPNYFMN